MSVVDDTRKLLQDLIAPDLKALQVQVSSLEKSVDARFNSVDARFDSLGKSVDARFDAQDRVIAAGFAAQDAKMTALNDRLLFLSEKVDAHREAAQADTRLLLANLGMLTNTLQDVSTRLRHMESTWERERYAASKGTPGAPPSAAA